HLSPSDDLARPARRRKARRHPTLGGLAMKRTALLVLAACSTNTAPVPKTTAAPSPAPAASAARDLRPGLDLAGPVAPPQKRGRSHGKGLVLDLGADRAVADVRLPRPPAGGAAPFTFGDDREGWVARTPESMQIPTVAFGDGRVYVSSGFETRSVYALDA